MHFANFVINLDLNTILIYGIVYLLLFLFYYMVFQTETQNTGYYRDSVWYQPIKFWWAKNAVKNYQNKYSNILLQETNEELEKPNKLTSFQQTDRQIIYGTDENNSFFYLKLVFRENRIIETCLYLRLKDGTVYQLPEHPAVLISSIPERQWTTKSLTFDVIEPFQVIQITYNGLLRNCTEGSRNIEHVYFKFVWTYTSKPIFHPQESNADILSNAVAKEPWKDGQWINFLGSEHAYKQFGALLGCVKRPNSMHLPVHLHLLSCRTRLWGPSESNNVYRNVTVFATSLDGFSFLIGVKSFQNGCRELQYGALGFSNGKRYAIDKCNLSLVDFDEDIVPRAFKFDFTVKHKNFRCSVFVMDRMAAFASDDCKGWRSEVHGARCMLNGAEKTGSVVFWHGRAGPGLCHPPYIVRPGELCTDERRMFVANLAAPECRSLSLAGERAVSVALLHAVHRRSPPESFHVPPGFCVLAPALRHHVERSGSLCDAVDLLAGCCNSADVQVACETVCSLLLSEPLPEDLRQAIRSEMLALRLHGGRFVAVPSYIEHSEYLSANRHSGRLFDLVHDEQVEAAIKQCWTTQFTFENVCHKRMHSKFSYDMSVVVRALVPSDVSGNLFTNHPSQADPSRMLLTANFGYIRGSQLTSKEADDITISRTWDDELRIESQTIGTKSKCYARTQDGVVWSEPPAGSELKLCLDERQVMRVAKMGVLVEKSFGKPCLIKWTYCNDALYVLSVLQSFNLNNFSSFIIPHENVAEITGDNAGSNEHSDRLYGIAIGRKVVLGRACVVASLRDVKNIKSGDVLITTNVDVSYSAMYPRLNGLVTELNGVHSYATTVARECNIPCLINCRRATRSFQTGDVVILNGKHGFIEKIG